MTFVILAWQIARAVVILKRLTLAAESLADSQRQLVAIERQRTPAPRDIRKAEISVASVEDWNKRWTEEHPTLESLER